LLLVEWSAAVFGGSSLVPQSNTVHRLLGALVVTLAPAGWTHLGEYFEGTETATVVNIEGKK